MDPSRQKSLEKARALEEKVLLNNDVDAMIELARMLLEDDVSHHARARQMLERAVKQAQNPEAMYVLAVSLMEEEDESQQRRAFSLLERSLRIQEHPAVLLCMARCYSQGLGVKRDCKLMRQLCERSLRLKQDPYAMAFLASNLLLYPEMCSQTKRALQLFREAIRLSSDHELMNNLAVLYHEGRGNLRPCPKRASKWYLRAIRASKQPLTMNNLACLLLENDPSDKNVIQAIGMLEDALQCDHGKSEYIFISLADAYLEHGNNAQRAFQLYEVAAIRFNSSEAQSRIINSLLDGTDAVFDDYARILQLFWQVYKTHDSFNALMTFAEMLWTGAKRVPMNRKKAIEVLHSLQWNCHYCFSLMLRHDLSNYPRGKKRARTLLQQLDEKIDRCDFGGSECIVLSESKCDSDKLLALQKLRAQTEKKRSTIAWLVPHLRVGRHILPFDGHPDWVTDVMRRFTLFKSIDSLNLASLVLEIEGEQQEAVTVLEGLMSSDLRLIAMLNLSYILMNDVQGVTKEVTRGMKLLEDAVKETNEVSARAMLANALSRGPDSDAGDVERGWKLWQSVEEDVNDDEELRKVRRLISAGCEENWAARGFGKG